MMRTRSLLAACTVAAAVALSTAVLQADTASVAAARELYASAAYDDALKMLDDMLEGSRTADERQTIGLYRALCFVAMGRSADADRAIDALIADHPLYRPAGDDLPPRMRDALSGARKRLLPSIVQQHYAMAKEAFDREDFAIAFPAFKRVLDELSDPDIKAAASQLPLSDLRVLATGFYDLSKKAAAPPLVPATAVTVVQAPQTRNFLRVYSAEEPDVVQPVAIRQTFPRFPVTVTSVMTGTVEVTIDATGVVESAVIVASLGGKYDALVVAAAKKWQYRPATVDGVPVRFMKRVIIRLTPDPQ